MTSTAAPKATIENDICCSAEFLDSAGYTVRELVAKPSIIEKFMALHAQVLEALPAHGKHWVKPRDAENVTNHLKQGHIGLGVFDANGHMVGQALLTFPDLPGGKNLKGYPIGYFHGLYAPEDCLVIQTLGVIKKGVARLLLDKAEEIAHERYRRHLLAKTDVANDKSIKVFEDAKFTASGETSVIGEEYTCVFMHKPLTLASNAVKANLPYSHLSA
mgnify:CR=1 FL=1